MHHDHCYELSRGVALAGRAIRNCVRDITDIGAGALVVPAPVGRGACMSTVPADFIVGRQIDLQEDWGSLHETLSVVLGVLCCGHCINSSISH